VVVCSVCVCVLGVCVASMCLLVCVWCVAKRRWFSGKISRCHRDAPGSIPGRRILLCFARLLVCSFTSLLLCFFASCFTLLFLASPSYSFLFLPIPSYSFLFLPIPPSSLLCSLLFSPASMSTCQPVDLYSLLPHTAHLLAAAGPTPSSRSCSHVFARFGVSSPFSFSIACDLFWDVVRGFDLLLAISCRRVLCLFRSLLVSRVFSRVARQTRVGRVPVVSCHSSSFLVSRLLVLP
jgi:hypothetical protein